MRHHKRAQNRRKNAPASTGHGWAWLLFGVILGSVLGSVGYLKWYENRPHAIPPMVAAKPAKLPKPQFDFYTLLPDAQVEETRSPGQPAIAKAPAPIPDEIATPQDDQSTKSSIYRLQIASFKAFQDADALKARLALSGYALEIQSVKLDNGGIWYRVQTPPLASQTEALKMQSALKAEAITSIIINK